MNKQKLSYTLFTFLVVLVLSCTPTSYLANFTPPSTWPTVSKTEDELIEYFDKNKNNLNPIEGIWNYSSNINVRNRLTGEQSGTRTVQNTMQLAIIKKDFTSSREFNAVIISSEGSHWNYPGRVKAIFKSTAYKNSYAVKWFQKHYNETSSNFFIDEDGLMKGKFEFTIQNNFLANIEASLMKSYPPYDDFSKLLSKELIDAGEKTDEKLWRMPLHKNFDKLMDSKNADMQNINYVGGAGSTTAAQFLQRFILNKTPWAHLDIAGMAFSKYGGALNSSGATGYGVRLLNKLVEDNYE